MLNISKNIILFVSLLSIFFFVAGYSAFSAVASSDSKEVSKPSFEVNLSNDKLFVGQSFILEFSLKGASVKTAPDFSQISKDFVIVSNGQSLKTTMINGVLSSSISWYFTLIAKKEGEYEIPSISVDTNLGKLKTDPVNIVVEKSKSSPKFKGLDGKKKEYKEDFEQISVDAYINKDNILPNEPFFYTARLISSKKIRDVKISNLIIDNAIVKKQGKPKIYNSKIDGKNVQIVEINYLITPIKSGSFEIPPLTFIGKTEQYKRSSIGGGYIFDDSLFDVFRVYYKDFSISTNNIKVNVKEPPVKIKPWLVADSLKISEYIDIKGGAMLGRPIKINFTIVANGVVGDIIPSLETQIKNIKGFSFHKESVDTGYNISNDDDKNIVGWKEEVYTLIPQKLGILKLPEVKISWWSLKDGKVIDTIIKAKEINVAKGE